MGGSPLPIVNVFVLPVAASIYIAVKEPLPLILSGIYFCGQTASASAPTG
ncbi:DUF2109 family protein [Enterobacter cloacae]